jgi:hypothetical protein
VTRRVPPPRLRTPGVGARSRGGGTIAGMDRETTSPTRRDPTGLRAGQRAFNDLAARDPQLAELLRGSAYDPFYDDSRLDAFHDWLERHAMADAPAGHGVAQPAGTDERTAPDREPHQRLLDALRQHRDTLAELLDTVSDQSEDGEDLLYRFWHQSLKVYRLQELTVAIHDALAAAAPDGAPLDDRYRQIVAEGTGHHFTLDANDRWLSATRPIVEAYLHSVHLLRLAVRYATELERAPQMLPSGWATLLHLYSIR